MSGHVSVLLNEVVQALEPAPRWKASMRRGVAPLSRAICCVSHA